MKDERGEAEGGPRAVKDERGDAETTGTTVMGATGGFAVNDVRGEGAADEVTEFGDGTAEEAGGLGEGAADEVTDFGDGIGDTSGEGEGEGPSSGKKIDVLLV